jgi:HSP20 family protein
MSEDYTPRIHEDDATTAAGTAGATTTEGMVHGQVPGTQVPDAHVPDSGVPDGRAPGTQVPDAESRGRAPRDLMDIVGSNWPFGPGTRQWLAGPWRDSWRDALPRAVRDSETQQIRVEETTQGGTHVVRAELPGVDPEQDIDVSVEDGDLVISARRHQRSESTEGGVHRSEFRYGSFSRRLPLPRGANSTDIAASYRDGVLEVRLPVTAGSGGSQRVPVNRG